MVEFMNCAYLIFIFKDDRNVRIFISVCQILIRNFYNELYEVISPVSQFKIIRDNIHKDRQMILTLQYLAVFTRNGLLDIFTSR